jgi:hypothetical protein
MMTAPVEVQAVPEAPVVRLALRVRQGQVVQRVGVALVEREVPQARVALLVQRALRVRRAPQEQRVPRGRLVALMGEWSTPGLTRRTPRSSARGSVGVSRRPPRCSVGLRPSPDAEATLQIMFQEGASAARALASALF